MGGKIPRAIKLQVLHGWMSGISRDDISLNNSISTGAVSNIIKEFRTGEVIDIDLLRETAVIMKNEGLGLNDLSSAIRLRKMLDFLELPEEQVEKFLLELSIYNYKNDIKDSKEFILAVKRVSGYVSRLDISIFDIIDEIEKKNSELRKLNNEILAERMELEGLKYKQSIMKSNIDRCKDAGSFADDKNNH